MSRQTKTDIQGQIISKMVDHVAYWIVNDPKIKGALEEFLIAECNDHGITYGALYSAPEGHPLYILYYEWCGKFQTRLLIAAAGVM